MAPQIVIESITLDNLVLPDSVDPVVVGAVLAHTSRDGSQTEQIHATILEAINSGMYDIILAPEFTYVQHDGNDKNTNNMEQQLLTKAEMDGCLNELISASVGRDALVIPGTFQYEDERRFLPPNIAYAIYQGKVLHRHEKLHDSAYDFYWKNLHIGISICSEAILERLSLDLLLHPSCGISDYAGFGVKKNGHVITLDGQYTPAGLLHILQDHSTNWDRSYKKLWSAVVLKRQ
ncbi:MAG: hypothetical protein AABX34_07280 [Nanoarchaeota archaeon]